MNPTRLRLVNHPNLILRNDVQRQDLLREAEHGETYAGTQTELVALLLDLLDDGHFIEATMIQTGHHDDGPRGHAGGFCLDGWFNASARQGDYLDAGDQRFKDGLYDVGKSKYSRQTGVVGDGADSAECFHYARKGYIERGAYVEGESVFQDDGGAHVHFGANGF